MHKFDQQFGNCPNCEKLSDSIKKLKSENQKLMDESKKLEYKV